MLLVLQHLAYVCWLSTKKDTYVRVLTLSKARTPLYSLKKKENRQTYRIGRTGMALEGDHNPFKDSNEST
jgi:hypothetical protein